MSSDVRRTTIEERLAEALRDVRLRLENRIEAHRIGRGEAITCVIDRALLDYDRTRPPEAARSPDGAVGGEEIASVETAWRCAKCGQLNNFYAVSCGRCECSYATSLPPLAESSCSTCNRNGVIGKPCPECGYPPAPPDPRASQLERWGLRWKGHDNAVVERMPDGYWTPWHHAQAALDAQVSLSTAPAAPATTGARAEAVADFGCEGCGAPYGKDGWCDVIVPDEVWNSLGKSLLCFRCMTKALIAKGYSPNNPVPVIVASGPYEDANEKWRLIGLEHGRKIAEEATAPPEVTHGAAIGGDVVTGVSLIAAERERQVTAEGWTPAHDDKHTDDELAIAAVIYAAEIDRLLRARATASTRSDGGDVGRDAK